MTIEQAITDYKSYFGESLYNESPYFLENNINPDDYMGRLADRVKKPYDVYPEAFTNKRVLDLGANIGDQSFILNAMGNTVTAFDINTEIVNLLGDYVPETVVKTDSLDVVKENTYDTVFCSSVIILQKDPYAWFESLFDIDFKTLVLIYYNGYTIPNHGGSKMYSPDDLGDNTPMINKQELLSICERLNLTVIESDLNWQEGVPINGISYRQTVLIVEKTLI